MSYADQIFINMCKDILENGTSTEGEKVRHIGKMEQVLLQLKNLELLIDMIYLKNFHC